MPRRNGRGRETSEPLDLTPADIPRPKFPHTGNTREDREARAIAERERVERQRTARINRGIDWTVCLVPGCGEELHFYGRPRFDRPELRDHEYQLPLCLKHLYVAFRQAKEAADEDLPVCVEANALVKERRQAKIDALQDAAKKAHLARTDGHIYVVRLNGLIKVGWSRDVDARLRAYGPDVEVLCIYPGTRDDETNLHRQFTPIRARGREWYEDGRVIADFVTKMVAEHGQPKIFDTWTKPKRIVAGKRH